MIVQFFKTTWNTEHCNIWMHHFANPEKNQNPATFWPETDLGWIWKICRFSVGAGAEIRYSTKISIPLANNFQNKMICSRIHLIKSCYLPKVEIWYIPTYITEWKHDNTNKFHADM